MKNKRVNLYDLTRLADDEPLSERYVKYVSGAERKKRYHHCEITAVKRLCEKLKLDVDDADGFIYGYGVPQISKEFDLLKISDRVCVNVELKSLPVPTERIAKQLRQNLHYLKMTDADDIRLFTYVSETDEIYVLNVAGEVEKTDLAALNSSLCGLESVDVDLDEVFRASKVLVSPLNDTERFLEKRYLLTDHQNEIRNKVLRFYYENEGARFYSVTGGPGTGKTLLVYDIARTIAENKKVVIVHSGMLCEGHGVLNDSLANLRIISVKELKKNGLPEADAVIVDEAHRMRDLILGELCEKVRERNAFCLFSFDEGQKLSQFENRLHNVETINALCGLNTDKLTNKIRTNEEMASFIRCLLDLSKYVPSRSFPNVKIAYVPNKVDAVSYAKKAEEEGYTYISYTPSSYNSSLNYQEGDYNTHKVIGQEFDGVCMILDDNFYYDGKTLKAKTHPNPDYLFEKLLYQGITRVRSRLLIVITQKSLLNNVLALFENQPIVLNGGSDGENN